MKRILILSVAIALALASTSEAQVFVRAPFVRVGVGPFGGVAVRAPFVNLFVPGDGPVYGPYGPYYTQPYYGPFYPQPIIVGTPPPPAQPSTPAQPAQPPQPGLPGVQLPPPPQPVPLPPVNGTSAPPVPSQAPQALTLESFAKTFQPKAGSYEMALINPITRQATNVRFALPAGTPRRVITTRDSVEFVYGLRQWVRIEFDKEGAIVTSR